MFTSSYPLNSKKERERDLLSFLRNVTYYLEFEEVFIAVKKREIVPINNLSLINPDMLNWKKFMMPLFEDWLINTEHYIKDGKGFWKNDMGLINSRWCELNICSRYCLVDFKSRNFDKEESYWGKTNKYNYVIIIDPYYCDPTDDDWDIDWIG